MKLTEHEVQQLFQRVTARRSGEACPDGDLLTRAAYGEATDAERDHVVEHIARCSDCAREYRIARGMRPAQPVATKRLPLAEAAMLIVAIGALAWMMTLGRPAPAPAPQPPAPAALQIGTPIVDLDADAVRGSSAAVPPIAVPSTANSFTLILHCPADLDGRVEIDLDGRQAAHGVAEAGAVTVTISRDSLKDGEHVIHVRRANRTADFHFSFSHP